MQRPRSKLGYKNSRLKERSKLMSILLSLGIQLTEFEFPKLYVARLLVKFAIEEIVMNLKIKKIPFRHRETEQEESKRKVEKIEKKKVKDLEKRREKRRNESETKKRKMDPHETEEQKTSEEPCFKKPLLVKNDMPPPPPGFRAQGAPPPGFKGDVAPPPGFKGDVAPPPGFKEPSTSAAPPGHVHDDAEKQIRTGNKCFFFVGHWSLSAYELSFHSKPWSWIL